MFSGSPRRPQHRKISYILRGCSSPTKPITTQQHCAGHLVGVNAVAVSEGSGFVASAGRDTTVRLWERSSSHGFTCTKVLDDHAETVHDVIFMEESDAQEFSVASCSSDNTVMLRTSRGNAVNATHTDSVRRIRRCGVHLVTASSDGTMLVLDVAQSLVLSSKASIGKPLMGLTSTRESESLVAVGCAEGVLHLFDIRAPIDQCVRHKGAHSAAINDVLFTGPTSLLSAGADGVVRLWDTRSPRYALHLVTHTQGVFSLSQLSESTFMSSSRDGTVAATNVTDLCTSTIVVEPNPIHHIAYSTTTGLLFCSGPVAGVNIYSRRQLLSPHFDGGLTTSAAVTSTMTPPCDDRSISPSRISLEITSDAELPKADSLVAVEPRKYASLLLHEVQFENKKQREQWSSARRNGRPQRAAPSQPVGSLPPQLGGVVDCVVLNDKRHVVAEDDQGVFTLWSLLKRVPICTIDSDPGSSLEDVVKGVTAADTWCPKWCVAEPRWGCICVTLAFEEAFSAVVSRWDLESHLPLEPPPLLSIYSMSPSQRLAYRKHSLLNLGKTALYSLVHDAALTDFIIVWSHRPSAGQVDCRSCTKLPLRERTSGSDNGGGGSDSGAADRFSCTTAPNGDLPTWIQAVVDSERVISPPAAFLRPITVEIRAATASPGSAPFPTPRKGYVTFSYDPHIPLARVAEDLVKELGLSSKMPVRSATIAAQLATATAVDKSIHSSPAARPFIEDPSVESLLPDEFVELSPHDEGIALDPLMSVSTAAMLHRRKGDRVDQLALRYRKHPSLK